MKNAHPPHPRETLARGPVCTVELCDCGCLHLILGALTLRLDAAAAEALCATLGDAITEVWRRREQVERWPPCVGDVS